MTTTVLEGPKTRKRSARSLKREIYDRLVGIDDTDFLRAIALLMRDKQETPLEIPEELQRRIEEGKRQLAAGQGIPLGVVMKKMRQRFPCER